MQTPGGSSPREGMTRPVAVPFDAAPTIAADGRSRDLRKDGASSCRPRPPMLLRPNSEPVRPRTRPDWPPSVTYRGLLRRGSGHAGVEGGVQGDRGVDQRQVGERLREVADLLAGQGDLLGVQPDVVGVGEHLLEGLPGVLEPAGAGRGRRRRRTCTARRCPPTRAGRRARPRGRSGRPGCRSPVPRPSPRSVDSHSGSVPSMNPTVGIRSSEESRTSVS